MKTMRWEPTSALDFFDSLDFFRDELDRCSDGFRTPDVRGIFDRTLTPAVDLVETAEGFVVNVDVPGVDRKDIDITMTSTVLSIQGEKKETSGDEGRKYFRKETWAGRFHRTLNLPETADPEKVAADLKDGVLTISIPKREEVKPRLISIGIN